MMRTRGAGVSRFAKSYAWVVLALATNGAVVLAQQTRVVQARAKMDTAIRRDSTRVVTARPLMRIVVDKIDSLARLQESLPIGSPEYARVADEIQATIRASIINGLPLIGETGTFSIKLRSGDDSLGRTPFPVERVLIDVSPRGWLGFQADGAYVKDAYPDGVHIQYFVYPTVVSVDPNSPASRVGIQFGDSLIAYNGWDLRKTTFNLTRLLEPGRTLKMLLRRDGQAKEIAITPEKLPPEMERERQVAAVARMTAPSRAPFVLGDSDRRLVEHRMQPDPPRAAQGGRGQATTITRPSVAAVMPSGILGVQLTEVDSLMAMNLSQQKVWHGVLAATPAHGSPAERMGLRGGDIIVAVDDVDIYSRSQLYREVSARGPNRTTQFVIVRSGKTEKLTYDPR